MSRATLPQRLLDLAAAARKVRARQVRGAPPLAIQKIRTSTSLQKATPMTTTTPLRKTTTGYGFVVRFSDGKINSIDLPSALAIVRALNSGKASAKVATSPSSSVTVAVRHVTCVELDRNAASAQGGGQDGARIGGCSLSGGMVITLTLESVAAVNTAIANGDATVEAVTMGNVKMALNVAHIVQTTY